MFREGEFEGKDVPLVSNYTASAGVTWNIWQNYLVFDATVRAWASASWTTTRPTPSAASRQCDRRLKLSGAYDRFFWSVSVNNLFDAQYYDYAVASLSTPGRFSAYPLPGRTYMVKAGATF